MRISFSGRDIPNILTIIRVLISPIVYILFSIGNPTVDRITAFIFIIGAITDMLDGLIARRMDASSDFGKIVDPVADKLFMFSALLPFVARGIIPSFILYVIFFRDMIIMALRNLVASRGITTHSDIMGKIKTFVLFLSVCIYPFGYDRYAVYGFYLGALISLVSGVNYSVKYVKLLTGGENV